MSELVGLVFPWAVLAPPILAVAARLLGNRSQSRTFHDQIAANRVNTLTTVAATVSVVVLVWFLIAAFFGNAPDVAMSVGIVAGVATLAAAALGYRFGDRFVLAALHAREVEPDPADPHEQELLDVVREMAIAANIPMPRVHVVDGDERPNALATGRNPDHASIAVTRGLLQTMDREQLQGVVAHEVAHIRNHDARLNLVLAVLGGAIVLFFAGLLKMMSNTSVSGGGCLSVIAGILLSILLFVILWCLRAIAAAVARILQASVSREREFLADATAVAIGRNPHGLRRALVTLAATPPTWAGRSDDDDGKAAKPPAADDGFRHLYFVDSETMLDDESTGLFATHPSLRERIARIDEIAPKVVAR